MSEQTPLVTVRSLVYNHEPYLRDCINGFLIQKTNFKFEVHLHDDASTDRSQAIIKEYAEKHPDIIKPFFEEENQYSKGMNALLNWGEVKTKYVALCEGDDYWTDPNKLQMQVDFLEAHPEYSMCFHDVDIKAEKGRECYDVFGKLEDRDYTGMENMVTWSVPTCSMVMRREVYLSRPMNPKFTMGDNVVVLTASRMGKIRCIPKKMGVYRLTPTSWIGGQSAKVQRYKYISHYLGLIEEFEECRCTTMYDILENQYFQLLSILKREGNKEEFEKVKAAYLNYPGENHFSRFQSYYTKDRIRGTLKALLGKGFVKMYRKMRG